MEPANRLTDSAKKKFAFYEKPLYLCLWSYVRQLSAGLLFFVNTYFSSCAKEEVAPEASAEAVAAKKKGGGDVWKDLPDCRCYMSVLGAENAPEYWGVYDMADGNSSTGYLLWGIGNDDWIDGTNYSLFPSSFMELDVPSTGDHQIRVWPANTTASDDFTIHVEIKCRYGDLDGGLGGRTYNFSFVYGEGEDIFGIFRDFYLEDLKCEYDVAGEGKK